MLGLTVTDLLHRLDPEASEGGKSRRRAALVSAPSLARRADALGLPALLRLGRGEEKSGGRSKAAIWADAYEAVLAALYLDGGYEAARRFVSEEFEADVAAPEAASVDPKSRLQERMQAQGRPLPSYSVLSEEGPDHRRRFRIECRLDDGTLTVGEGSSKKEAQQAAAARAALDLLRGWSPAAVIGARGQAGPVSPTATPSATPRSHASGRAISRGTGLVLEGARRDDEFVRGIGRREHAHANRAPVGRLHHAAPAHPARGCRTCWRSSTPATSGSGTTRVWRSVPMRSSRAPQSIRTCRGRPDERPAQPTRASMRPTRVSMTSATTRGSTGMAWRLGSRK